MTRPDSPHGHLRSPVDISTAHAAARRYRAELSRDIVRAMTRGLSGGLTGSRR